jgi:hypothetical protein
VAIVEFVAFAGLALGGFVALVAEWVAVVVVVALLEDELEPPHATSAADSRTTAAAIAVRLATRIIAALRHMLRPPSDSI